MIKNAYLALFTLSLIQACGTEREYYDTELEIMCRTQTLDAKELKVRTVDYGIQLEQVEVQLATAKDHYSLADSCIPFSLIVTNKGNDSIQLTEEQLVELNDNIIGFYGVSTRLFWEEFLPVTDDPILRGAQWMPGESIEFTAFISMDRIKLYTPPKFGQTFTQWDASFQGPSVFLGITSVKASVTIEYDPITEKVEEPGADGSYIAGMVLLGFKDDIDLEKAEEIILNADSFISSAMYFDRSGAAAVIIPPNKTTDEMIKYFLSNPNVRYAERNNILRAH